MKHAGARTSLLIFALTTTVFVSALYGYMYYVVEASVRDALAAREQASQREQFLAQEKEISAAYEATAVDRARLPTFFVSDNATISFIETVETLGDKVGSTVTLSGINADNLDTTEPGTIGTIKVNVDVRGSWSAVMRTLGLAEVLPYRVSIQRVRLDSSGSLPTPGAKQVVPQWSATFTIEAALIHVAPNK